MSTLAPRWRRLYVYVCAIYTDNSTDYLHGCYYKPSSFSIIVYRLRDESCYYSPNYRETSIKD